ncbi:MAG TPA: alpha-galactosidase [Gemmatimonadales bacterium]
MDRRTFLLLTGATSGAILGPGLLGATGSTRVGRLRVTLDDERRWSLWYQGGGTPIPLLRDATLGAWIGTRFVALGDLEDTVIGNRRPPSGDALVVRGSAGDVVIEAEFVTGQEGAAPEASVTISIYPDRQLPSCRGVRYFELPETGVLPGSGHLLALVNGYESGSPSRITRVPPINGPLESHAALGLTRGSQGLGMAFDPGEPGDGKVRLTADGLSAASDWLPPRPVRSQGDGATLRVAYSPDGDGLAALAALFSPASPVDRERLASLTVPAGWSSRYALAAREVSEDRVLANVERCVTTFDARHLRCIQVDDGYQRAAGDWETNERFSHGHRWLTDHIHARGLTAGLWIAPFAATERSGLPATHPDWLLRDSSGPVVFATRDDWGGPVFGLDGAHPGVQEWLYRLSRRVVQDWGYEYVAADYLPWMVHGAAHHGGLTHAEACRRGLAAIRDGLGPDVFLVGAHAPLQHAQGVVNGMRVGPDVDASWSSLRASARALALRSFYHRAAWFNHPDCLLVRPPLTDVEARTWASVVSISGALTFLSDDLQSLPSERLDLLHRSLPAAPMAGHPVDVVSDGAERTPSVWMAQGAADWWTVAVVNWDDDAKEISVPLVDLGIPTSRCAAYDVWRGVPLPDVRERVTATVPPHDALVVGLRPVVTRPQVIGTTRHVVQGAVDLSAQEWNVRTRTLSGRSTALDGRPYAVTIAVPAALRPVACRADVPCETRPLESGHVVLEWPPGGDGRDIEWEVRFQATRRR